MNPLKQNLSVKNSAQTANNEQNTGAPFVDMNYCRRPISLAARNESFDSGSLNGGVLLNVICNAVPQVSQWPIYR
jgi:hypothetical protein